MCNEDKNGQMYESNRFDPLHRQAHVVRDGLSERLQLGYSKMKKVHNHQSSESGDPGGGHRPGD